MLSSRLRCRHRAAVSTRKTRKNPSAEAYGCGRFFAPVNFAEVFIELSLICFMKLSLLGVLRNQKFARIHRRENQISVLVCVFLSACIYSP